MSLVGVATEVKAMGNIIVSRSENMLHVSGFLESRYKKKVTIGIDSSSD